MLKYAFAFLTGLIGLSLLGFGAYFTYKQAISMMAGFSWIKLLYLAGAVVMLIAGAWATSKAVKDFKAAREESSDDDQKPQSGGTMTAIKGGSFSTPEVGMLSIKQQKERLGAA